LVGVDGLDPAIIVVIALKDPYPYLLEALTWN
jgi:hypothetical protein